MSEEFSSSLEPVLFRHISKHPEALLDKLAARLDQPESGKQAFFTLVKVAKFFFMENARQASTVFADVIFSRWSFIAQISGDSKENFLFTVHLLNHLLLLDRAKCQKVTCRISRCQL